MTDISAIRQPDYDGDSMLAAVRRHFEALGIDGEFHAGIKVLLKPNLLMRRSPEQATTTHPAVVTAVAAHLRELGVTDITLADSPGGPYTKSALESTYAACDMWEAARAGAALNVDVGWRQVTNPAPGSLCKTFHLIEPVICADYIINLPKLKTHAMMTYSGAVKNMFGCIPGLQKPEMHFRFPQQQRFAQMLVELARVTRPQLTIIDAVVAMEGDGPSAGTPRSMGWLFAARDPYVLDAALCGVIGFDPAQVPTVAYAKAIGLGVDEYRFVGDGAPEGIPPFKLPASGRVDFTTSVPKPLRGIGRALTGRLLSPRPAVKAKSCFGCGRCAESCPAHTITVRNRVAVINYDNCIKCYCCHELCPARAIEIRRFRLLDY